MVKRKRSLAETTRPNGRDGALKDIPSSLKKHFEADGRLRLPKAYESVDENEPWRETQQWAALALDLRDEALVMSLAYIGLKGRSGVLDEILVLTNLAIMLGTVDKPPEIPVEGEAICRLVGGDLHSLYETSIRVSRRSILTSQPIGKDGDENLAPEFAARLACRVVSWIEAGLKELRAKADGQNPFDWGPVTPSTSLDEISTIVTEWRKWPEITKSTENFALLKTLDPVALMAARAQPTNQAMLMRVKTDLLRMRLNTFLTEMTTIWQSLEELKLAGHALAAIGLPFGRSLAETGAFLQRSLSRDAPPLATLPDDMIHETAKSALSRELAQKFSRLIPMPLEQRAGIAFLRMALDVGWSPSRLQGVPDSRSRHEEGLIACWLQARKRGLEPTPGNEESTRLALRIAERTLGYKPGTFSSAASGAQRKRSSRDYARKKKRAEGERKRRGQ